jgi:N-acetylmuramoyl-L-alanine amidase
MPISRKIFRVLGLWILGSVWVPSALALNEILNVRHWVAPDHTRVVIDMGEDVPFTVEKAERRIAIDLASTSLPSHIPSRILFHKPGVEEVTLSARTLSVVRVELAIPGQVQTNVFKLKKFQDKPDRIVIDIVLPEAAKQQSEAREKVKMTRKDRIVVIDPGHGGEAPGAVGKGGTLEKDVVLSMAKKLRDLLNRKEGYRAFLTRDGDYYVSFDKRLQIAREYGADLFVSIHADAAKNRSAAGSSIYTLSTGAASSEAARILAQNENLADVVGGVPSVEGNGASDPIILDMFQTHTINRSRTFGEMLLKNMAQVNPLKFDTVQEAPFRVLKLPEIPSVLIETAFISNPKEEKLLRSDRHRMGIAEKILRSIAEFLPPLPPSYAAASGGSEGEKESPGRIEMKAAEGGGRSGVRAAERESLEKGGKTPQEKTKETPRKDPDLYRVRKGDTLGKIAAHHGTSIAILLKLNGMKLHDPLQVDRLLKVPGTASAIREAEKKVSDPRRAAPDRSAAMTYKVRKGDTLSGIARRHGTTIRVLMETNQLKGSESLHAGRYLILPGKR